jgi:hypothetical protein
MNDFRETLDELFIEKLGYSGIYDKMSKPDIDGKENINEISHEYTNSQGVDVIMVECEDRIKDLQKQVIKYYKEKFPNGHFLFVSNEGKVFDLYNVATSKKLKPITYNELDKNTRLFKEKVELFSVDNSKDTLDLRINIDKAFETSDRITKKFYDKFKKIHKKLSDAIEGIDDKADKDWYASVLLNRIMFIYFLQKHGVIQNDKSYLLNKFDEVNFRGEDYYHDFLLPLFFVGFATRDNNPKKHDFTKRYGKVPYLNGGLFYPHKIEKKYAKQEEIAGVAIKIYDGENATVYQDEVTPNIQIKPTVLKEVLDFLNQYVWYLDNRPLKDEDGVNPDMLGYIFEKYINQKELGAYYTKEDITEYISKNTIIPFILDKLRSKGFDAPDPNPMITANDDINGNIADYIESIKEDYDQLKYLYKDILVELSVLDPSVGSGAFLFAALNILLPIYQKTFFKLELHQDKVNDKWLKEVLADKGNQPHDYYLTKQIILNNLYGVDIVEEATEICKLRLFLQLAAHLPNVKNIQPLPDIDFNIYSGNSLVGGLSWKDLQANYTLELFDRQGNAFDFDEIKANIIELTELKSEYRIVQTQLNGEENKIKAVHQKYKNLRQYNTEEEILKQLKIQIFNLEDSINNTINIGIDDPFHWFIEFNTIIKNGGFDVIIGNPPYVEYSKVKKSNNGYTINGFSTIKCGNLYAFIIERTYKLLNKINGRVGQIIPLSFICTKRMFSGQQFVIRNSNNLWFSSYAERPAKLFTGAEVSLVIMLSKFGKSSSIYTTKYHKWSANDRGNLFKQIKYIEIKGNLNNYSIPKISTQTAKNILQKLKLNKQKISTYITNNSENEIIYRNAGGRYYKIVLNHEPMFFVNDEQKMSSTYHKLYFDNEAYREAICAIMNSSLFYWYWIVYSDTWHMVKNDILPFPIDLDSVLIKNLQSLNQELMKDFEHYSEIKVESRNSGKDKIEYKKYYARSSKEIIDGIDKLLGHHYGFTNEELSFIINYDIKFRTN